jgi:4-alpha-glucanotransferase
VRIDHIIGLFRLWWVPQGDGPGGGTYVRYDHEAMVGILALEAQRAGAVVVGEDLGTVEPSARSYLAERGILGTSILWFENGQDGQPLPPQQWRGQSLASVTTHDLPPTAAYLAGDHVRLRDRLDLLTRPYQEELAADREARSAWLEALVREGVLAAEDGRLADDQGNGVDRALVRRQLLALHRYLWLSPARLINIMLTDAVGDRRAQNLPGTVDEYPNWRVRSGRAGVDQRGHRCGQVRLSRGPHGQVYIFARPRRLCANGRPSRRASRTAAGQLCSAGFSQ